MPPKIQPVTPVHLPQEADAAAWQQMDSTHQARQSARNMPQQRLGSPSGHTPPPQLQRPHGEPDVSATLSGAAPPPSHHGHSQPMQMPQMQPPPFQQPQYPGAPVAQQPYQQPYQQQPYQQQPQGGSDRQPLIGNEEISEVGAQPLVDDPRLGWSTNVNQAITGPISAAGGTSKGMSNDLADYKIRSNKGWILLAIFLVIGAAGAIAAIVLY